LRELRATEQSILQMNSLLEEEVETAREECDEVKGEYKDICDENRRIREQIEKVHTFLLPYFNNLLGGDEGEIDDDDGEGKEDTEKMEVDQTNAGDGEEKDDDESEEELDEITLGPFVLELARRFTQQQQQQQAATTTTAESSSNNS
jgi:hypothetical protein